MWFDMTTMVLAKTNELRKHFFVQDGGGQPEIIFLALKDVVCVGGGRRMRKNGEVIRLYNKGKAVCRVGPAAARLAVIHYQY
jgi:hypothetical protein